MKSQQNAPSLGQKLLSQVGHQLFDSAPKRRHLVQSLRSVFLVSD